MGWTIFCGFGISSGDEKWSIFLKGKMVNFPPVTSLFFGLVYRRFQNFADAAFPVWANNKNNRLNEHDQSKFHTHTHTSFDRFAKFSPQFFLWVHFVELVVVIYVRFCFFFDFFPCLLLKGFALSGLFGGIFVISAHFWRLFWRPNLSPRLNFFYFWRFLIPLFLACIT